MFKRIEIQLTGPICGCDEENLGWTIYNSVNKPGLCIRCRTCGTALSVPNEVFRASYALDEPYPGVDSAKVRALSVVRDVED